MAPDINVLVAAARGDHVHHDVARGWLETTLMEAPSNCVEILPVVASGFFRLVTNSRVFARPHTPRQAASYLNDLMSRPGISMPEVGHAGWQECQRLCCEHELTGPSVSDAYIAGTVIALGCRFVTFDRDFSRLLSPSRLTLLKPH